MTTMKRVLTAVALVSSGCEQRGGTPQTSSAPPKVVLSVPSAASVRSAAAPCVTPESTGAVALAKLTGESASETAAIAAARRELERVLEVPEDYFGSVQTAGDLILLELWHRSAFLPENCASEPVKGGAAQSTRCAKCRTVAYDPKLRRIVSTKVWEQPGD